MMAHPDTSRETLERIAQEFSSQRLPSKKPRLAAVQSPNQSGLQYAVFRF